MFPLHFRDSKLYFVGGCSGKYRSLWEYHDSIRTHIHAIYYFVLLRDKKVSETLNSLLHYRPWLRVLILFLLFLFPSSLQTSTIFFILSQNIHSIALLTHTDISPFLLWNLYSKLFCIYFHVSIKSFVTWHFHSFY